MTKDKCKPKKKITGSNPSEAWADEEKVDKKTNVNKPSNDAVQEAKDWVDDNEK